jgi:hypothetical protein
MRLGLFQHGWWNEAARALALPFDALPVALPSDGPGAGNPHAADVRARSANGMTVARRLRERPVDVLVDNGGAGLCFVSGGDDPAALVPLHEHVGRTLCSHFVDPLVTVFQGLDWGVVWPCLHSARWIKAVWDRAQAAELAAFGVPNVVHLPMAAPERSYDATPLDPKECTTPVSFVGAQNSTYFTSNAPVRTARLFAGTLAGAVAADLRGMTFYSVYHDLYGLGAPVDGRDDPRASADKSLRYFAAKLFYHASLCVRNRDRFVIFLKRKLGDQFRLVGRGWDTAYGLPTEGPFASNDDYFANFRRSAININLVNGNAETGLNMRHFEITAAGGFLLCYDQPELAGLFRIGEECAVFRNEEELLEKIRYYLEHPQQRCAIAQAGQQRTLREHLYRHRLHALLEHADRLGTPSASEPDRPAVRVLQQSNERASALPGTVADAPRDAATTGGVR